MIFVAKNEAGIRSWRYVIDGTKTITRRLKPMQIGKEFAVQPGRGKHAICRAVVTDCMLSRVHYHIYALNREIFKNIQDYKHNEANCEGFKTWDGLMHWMHKHKIIFDDTFRIEFKVIK